MDHNESSHTISVLVENEFGVLARVAGMFAGRGFNIDALSVAPTPDPRYSRITLITHGNELIIEQILKQLNRLIDVLKVVDLSSEATIRRELMLVKVRLGEHEESKVKKILEEHHGKLADDFNGRVWVLEFVNDHAHLEEILEKLKEFEILETVRTGNIAIQKGKKTLMPG